MIWAWFGIRAWLRCTVGNRGLRCGSQGTLTFRCWSGGFWSSWFRLRAWDGSRLQISWTPGLGLRARGWAKLNICWFGHVQLCFHWLIRGCFGLRCWEGFSFNYRTGLNFHSWWSTWLGLSSRWWTWFGFRGNRDGYSHRV